MRKLKFYEALDEAMLQAVRLDKNVFIYGLGVNKLLKYLRHVIVLQKNIQIIFSIRLQQNKL